MSANHPDDATNRYVREQITRIDRTQERIFRLRNESQPRIDAILAQAAKDRAMAAWNWPAIIAGVGAGLAGIGTIMSALVAGHIV